jgi:hypothetical protein
MWHLAMFLETRGGDFRHFVRKVLATLSMTSSHHFYSTPKDALDKNVIRSLFLVVVIGLFAV